MSKFSNIKITQLFALLFIGLSFSFCQTHEVLIKTNEHGDALIVNGEKFIINGMNWDMIPIGKDAVSTNFWQSSDEIIKLGLDHEMSLLRDMNINTIRHYSDIPPKWIEYIYKNYGIYTMINHSFGRYGLSVDGEWNPITDYSNSKMQKILLSEIETMAKDYRNTPGLLLYLLGNENNYGLFWSGAETEDFPEDETKKMAVGEKRGRPMYRLMNEASKIIKKLDGNHPVAICNGDNLFIDIIAQECDDVDILGVNSYRGASFTDLFKSVKEILNKPMLFTEFGADAFNAITKSEDQKPQAEYLLENWKEIYANVSGMGAYENTIGGFTFQFSDGWWKYNFDKRKNASKHDSISTWANGGYTSDLVSGKNNMNEEWFGICAKGPTDHNGLYNLYPRAAYYVLKQVHGFNPFNKNSNLNLLNEYFDDININESDSKGNLNKEILERINNTKDSIINALWVRSTNPVLNITFDQDPMVFRFNSFNGSSFKLSNINPVSENNTSTTTSGVFINTGNAWEGNYLDLKSQINLEKGSTIKLNLHSDKSVEIVVKLENSSGENSSTEDAKFHSGNGWEELNFSFSSAEKYNRLVVFIDGPGNTAGEFYIKSIIQSNSKIQIKK
ncbi:MAG: glycoside hydrolase family 2 TIM barrel-domain containing protein [Flavobacteriaceae bacterium]